MRQWRGAWQPAEARGDSTRVCRNSGPGAAAGASLAGFGGAARCALAGRKFEPATGVENRAHCNASHTVQELAARLDTLEDVTRWIETMLVAEPPLTLVDGGAIALGVDAELDDLRTFRPPAGRRLRPSKRESGSGLVSARSRCAITPSSAITSRSLKPICRSLLPTMSASRRWSMRAVHDAGAEGV